MAISPKVELRGLCPKPLAEALDAIAMAKGLDRNTYVLRLLEGAVAAYLHEQTVVGRALHGNPLLVEAERKTRRY